MVCDRHRHSVGLMEVISNCNGWVMYFVFACSLMIYRTAQTRHVCFCNLFVYLTRQFLRRDCYEKIYYTQTIWLPTGFRTNRETQGRRWTGGGTRLPELCD